MQNITRRDWPDIAAAQMGRLARDNEVVLLRDAATPDALQKACDALEVALQETPNDPVCLFVLGQVLCRRQMLAKATPLLEKLANSEDLRSRHNAYPLLKKCYETSRDMLKLAHLKEQATKDGFQLR